MARSPLDPVTARQVATDAHLSANAYTTAPDAALEQLDFSDPIVRSSLALWAGAHGDQPECAPLVAAILAVVGEHLAVEQGRERAAAPKHSAP